MTETMIMEPSPQTATTANQNLDQKGVLELFDLWNNALKSEDPAQVALLYAEDAILMPTLSKIVRHNRVEIEDYFHFFLSFKPISTLNESNIRIFGDTAIHSGLYTFSLDVNGNPMERQVRFTFVYRNINKHWMIVEHHSSAMPEI